MRFVFLFTLNIFAVNTIHGQSRIKANVLLLPVGIINVGVEVPVQKKVTFQSELMISPWKSFFGRNFQIYMLTLEGRYYLMENYNKFYVGGYVSGASFNLQKGKIPPENISVEGIEYHKGYAFVLGISAGYQLALSDKIDVDIFGGLGSSQSLYKAFYKSSDIRADHARKWNKSGELIPTRGGVSVTLKL